MGLIKFAEQIFESRGQRLREYQKDFLNDLLERNFTLNVSSRQMGITTLYSIYVAYCLLSDKKEVITYFSPKMDQTYRFISKVREIILSIAPSMIKDCNKTDIQLNNGNRAIGRTPQPDSLRGWEVTSIIIDGAKYIKAFDELLYSIGPISTGFHISTNDNGKIDCFNELFTSDSNRYYKKVYHYSLIDNYDISLKECLSKTEWDTEFELTNFNVPKVIKDYNIQFRVGGDIYQKIISKLPKNVTISEYMRDLIKKDLSSSGKVVNY
jgi:hypothetical protein